MTIDDVMTAAPVIPVLVLDGSVDPAVLAVTLPEGADQVGSPSWRAMRM